MLLDQTHQIKGREQTGCLVAERAFPPLAPYGSYRGGSRVITLGSEEELLLILRPLPRPLLFPHSRIKLDTPWSAATASTLSKVLRVDRLRDANLLGDVDDELISFPLKQDGSIV